MAEPGSSGKAGPTPIPSGEQVRPAFYVGAHQLRLGDKITAFHREKHKMIIGTFVLRYGEPCVSDAEGGLYHVNSLQIREVQPPLME